MSAHDSNEDIADPVQEESKPVLEPNPTDDGNQIQDAAPDASETSALTVPEEDSGPGAPPPSLEETHASEEPTSGDAQSQLEEDASEKEETPQRSLIEEPAINEVEEAQLDIQEAPKSETPPPSEEPPTVLTEVTEQQSHLSDVERDIRSMLGFHDEEVEPDDLNPEKMAAEILFEIINETLKSQEEPTAPDNLYVELSEHDQLTAFIEDTLGALADDIEMGEREYIPHDEAYFWMTYFFLQFCGFRIFLANIDEAIVHGQNLKELAEIVVDLVDNVANNAEYLHSDSDVPEHVAKNIIWQMLNSRMMLRRYDGRGVAYWQAEDILEEILERVTARQTTVKLREMHPGFSVRKSRVGKAESEKIEEPKVCREFGGIFNVAEDFVATLLDDSAKIIKHTVESSGPPPVLPKESQLSTKQAIRQVASVKSIQSSIKQPDVRHPVIYPRIEDFNAKEGKHTIINIVHRWKTKLLTEDWGYTVKFLMGQSDACSDYYIYEAKFGLPTTLYPIPQATCSLLFTIEVSRVKPPVCSVSVSYKVEGSGLVLIPEEYNFQEDWLVNVIDSKLRLFSRVRF